MDCVIGIDFDNTLVSYDEIVCNTAVQQGLIEPGAVLSKKDVRDRIRLLPHGEIEWQKLQAMVYGMRMDKATLEDGVREFFKSCKRYQVKAYVISHKTEVVKFGGATVNLRNAAVAWMIENEFFAAEGLGLSRQDIFFESTRRDKILRIRSLKCSHFIDDLEEIFLEDSFPSNVEKILYAPHMRDLPMSGTRTISSWSEMVHYFFDGGN